MAVLKVLYAVLIVYLLLLSLRIILSWFRSSIYGGAWDLLVRITEPYLSLFRGIRFLRQSVFDFTPIAAILTLVVAMDVVNMMILYGRITLGRVLGAVVGAAWSAAAFILLLLLIVGVVRLVLLLVRRDAYTYFGQALDTLLRPVVLFAERMLAPIRSADRLGYPQVLLVSLVFLLAVRLLAGWLIRLLVGLLVSLPV